MLIPVLQEGELDALTEVCSVGMGHAATALSQLMGKGVSIKVPRLRTMDRNSLAELLGGQELTGLHLRILGSVQGSILFLLREESAHRILELLLGTHSAAGTPLSELEESALKEVGNILASACLNALGTMLKMTLLPSVPALLNGAAGGLLTHILEQPDDGDILMIDTTFSISDILVDGSIFLAPSTASLGAILEALGAK